MCIRKFEIGYVKKKDQLSGGGTGASLAQSKEIRIGMTMPSEITFKMTNAAFVFTVTIDKPLPWQLVYSVL